MCHEIGRPHMRGLPDYQVPEIPTAMETILHMAKMVNRDVRFVGVSLNTSNVTPEEAAAFKKKTAEQTGLPVVDPLKDGVAPIVDRDRKTIVEGTSGAVRVDHVGSHLIQKQK